MGKQILIDGAGEGIGGGVLGFIKDGYEGSIKGIIGGFISGAATGFLSGGLGYKFQKPKVSAKNLDEISPGVRSKVDYIADGVSNPKLKFNNVGEYYSYITNIGKRVDINSEQKLAFIQEAYGALGNAKGDITCISDIKYLKPEGFGANGRPLVDWPKFMGFDVDTINGITRDNQLPTKWDRIGAISGENFTTLPNDGKIFSFDDRAIPYLENFQARHVGEFNNENYSEIIDAIKKIIFGGYMKQKSEADILL